MALHPVGPLPVSTYWRRRIVLLLGLLVVVLLLRSCAGGSTPRRTSSTPRATATPTSSAHPVASRPPVTAAVLCPDASLTLTSATDSAAYAVGAAPKITLTVKNTSKAACRRDLGAGAVELLVFSGPDRVWSSDDCNPSKAVALTLLGAGGTQAVVKTWPGTRSKPACSGSKAPAKGGTYRVVARVGTLRVEGAVFRLQG